MITKKTSKDIIIKLPVHRYHEIIITILKIYIHDVIDDVTRSQKKSNFKIDLSLSIFKLERRSMSEMLMAIFLVYSTSSITLLRIHRWLSTDAQSLKQHRRGAQLFFKVIHQILTPYGTKIADFDRN